MIYSVLTKPMIPVIPEQGSLPVEVSIRDAVLKAHEYYDIGGDTPMERYACVRFLAAFVMDMLEMKTLEERKSVFQAGRFDKDVFERYVMECAQEGASFDLFDDKAPFMQSVFSNKKSQLKAAAALDLCFPSGNAPTFHQSSASVLGYAIEDEKVMTPAKAFREMLVKYTYGAYSTEGSAGINGMPMFVYVIGKNLFETVMHHTLSEEEAAPREYGAGTVPWRENGIRVEESDQVEDKATLLQALTWMPRRVQLVLSDDGKVHKVYLAKGLKYSGPFWRDTNTYAYYSKTKKDYMNVVMRTVPDPWMYLNGVVYNGDLIAPDCVARINDLCTPEQSKRLKIRMSSISKNAKSYILYSMYETELDLPESFLRNPEYVEEYKQDVTLLSKTENSIQYAIRNCLPDGLVQQCTALFNRLAKEIIITVPAEDISREAEIEEHREVFCEEVKSAVNEVIRYIRTYMGKSSAELLNLCKAEDNIRKYLWVNIKERKEGKMSNDDGENGENGEDGEDDKESEME